MNICSKVSFALLLLLQSHSVQATTYSKKVGYIFNGADWIHDKDTRCSSTHQSPIDLRGGMNNDPFREDDGTDFVGQYSNLVQSTVTYNSKKVQVSIPSKSNENYCKSQHSVDTFNAAKSYSATHIDFRSRSEHTVDGRRYDLEMQIVHSADPETSARRLQEVKDDYEGTQVPETSTVSILFDQTAYDSANADEQEAVWNFFEALKLDSGATDDDSDGVTELAKDVDIPFGDLMSNVNFGNRWAYSGSDSEPPCTVGNLYHVIERVLPISEKHYKAMTTLMDATESVDYFDKTGTNQVADDSTTPAKRKLSLTGNYRITNKLDYHNVRYMRNDFKADDSTDPVVTMYALAIVVAILVALSLILAYFACKLMFDTQSVKAAEDDQVEMASARSSARSSRRQSQLA